MIKFLTPIFVFILFFSKNVFALNIAVINIEKIINDYSEYQNIIILLEESKNNYSKILEEKENNLNKIYNEIQESEILLDDNEINKMINDYNTELNNFNILVDNFNLHYQQQLIDIRNDILQEIIVLVENYAKNNQIDLILDSKNYLMASNNINITNLIYEQMNKVKLELDFKNFEQN